MKKEGGTKRRRETENERWVERGGREKWKINKSNLGCINHFRIA